MRKQWSFVLALSLGVSSSALIADEIPTKLPTDLKAPQEAKKLSSMSARKQFQRKAKSSPFWKFPSILPIPNGFPLVLSTFFGG